MNDRIDRVLLQYKVDEAALQQSKMATEGVQSTLDSLAAAGSSAFGSLAQDANAGLGAIRASLNQTEVTLGDLRDDFEKMESTGVGALQRVREEAQKKLIDESDPFNEILPDDNNGGRSQGGGGERSAGRLASRSLSELGGAVGGDLGKATSQAGGLLQTFAQLGPTAGIAAAGVIGVNLAFEQVAKGMKPVEQAIEGTLQGIKSYTDFVTKGGTTEDANKRIEELKKSITEQQQLRDQASGALNQAFADAQKQFGDVIARAEFATFGKGAADKFQGQIDQYNKSIDEQTTELNKLTKATQDGTLAENDRLAAEKKRLESLSVQVDYYRQYDAALKQSADTIRQRQEETQREMQITQLEINTIKNSGDTSQEAKDKLDQLNNKMEQLGVTADALKDALPGAQVVDNAKKAADQQTLLNNTLNSSTDSIKSQIEGIHNQRQAIEAGLQSLKDSGDTSQAVKDQIAAYNKQLQDLEQQENILTEQAYPLVKAREDEAKAMEYQKKQLEDTAASVKKYNADVQSINDKFHEDEARLEQKAADDQIKIIQRAADESAKALQQLEDTRAKDLLAAQRGETDAQTKLRDKEADDVLKEQRQEAQDLQTHLQRIRDIQQKAQDSEFEQGLDRDFAGLARSRRQTAQQIRDENQNFVSQQAQKRTQLAQTLADDRTAYERERAQRIVNLQRQLDDANSAYTAQLKQLVTKRDADLKIAQQADAAELQQARAKYTKELQLRQQAEVAELNLLRMSAEARLKLEAQTQQALIAQSYAIMAHAASGQAAGGGTSSSKATPYAEGGDIGIGQLALVNDAGRRESFNGTAFPNMKGLFIPLEKGTVDSGKGGANITINQSIQGGNNASPEAIAQISTQQITKVLKRLYA